MYIYIYIIIIYILYIIYIIIIYIMYTPSNLRESKIFSVGFSSFSSDLIESWSHLFGTIHKVLHSRNPGSLK